MLVQRALTVTAALLLIPWLAPAPAGAAGEVPDTFRVAVIDSGVDAAHPEFAPGQVVAWKDFVNGRPQPYDDHGHGTATASLVAGRNQGACGSTPKMSFAPGQPLVVAKVMDAAGNGNVGTIEQAIDWAVEQQAKVISISLGASIPVPLDLTPSVERARAAGVLVVVAAGNGAGNFGLVPLVSWGAGLGNEADALVVGGGTRTGTLLSTTSNTDPDVSSWSDNVCYAVANTTGYDTGTGTSLACPLVAGMAVEAMDIARAAGRDTSPYRIERVLLLSSTNNVFSPYAREGVGYLLTSEWARVQTAAASDESQSVLQARYEAQGAHATVDLRYHAALETLKRAMLG